MLPDRIKIKVIEDGSEVEKDFPFKFNFNSINAFRKDEGLSFEDFGKSFNGIEQGDFNSLESMGKLFHFALKEGCRMMGEDLTVSVEDVLAWMNDSSANITEAVKQFKESHPIDDESDEKKKKATP